MIYLKWLLQMMLNLFGFLTAPIMFPIAYVYAFIPFVRNKLLWIYFDDEDGYGYDVAWWMGDKKRNFWTAYKWCALRNPAWNLHTVFLFKKSDMFLPIKIKGGLIKNGNILKWDRWSIATLKYVDAQGNYMDNKGDYLSLKYSTLGKQFVIFKNLDEELYWRFSYAGNVYKSFWVEFQIGYSSRPTFRLKIKNIKDIL